MTGLYLTIDDSPSANFDVLCAWLKARDIPALFYCRGDSLSLYPEKIVQAIKDGFVISNHSWSHHYASKLGADMAVREVLKTQTLIDKAYAQAGVKQSIKSMRFPHMDSGLAGWPLVPETFNEDERADLKQVYGTFYNNDLKAPTDEHIKIHNNIEARLKQDGFEQIQFKDVNTEWYKTYARSSAVSTQGTFCHPDWHLHARHAGKDATVASLNKNFDDFIASHGDSTQILVMHDSFELWPYTQQLIQHMLDQGHKFLPIPQ